MPAPADARVLRSRQRLSEALVSLTLTGGFETITVRELTETAGVGYATFFRHFPSKEVLLERLLEDTLADLTAALGPTMTPGHGGFRPLQTCITVFTHARVNADIYRALLRTGDVTNLSERCLTLSRTTLQRSFVPKPGSVVPFEVAVRHLVGSFIGLIAWYLDAEMPHTPERMGEMVETLILEPIYRVALEPKP
jgi:AcrR family transcriptional regulator